MNTGGAIYSSCHNMNPNPYCSPPQCWAICSISPHLLCIIDCVSMLRQVPRSFSSQEHAYSRGWRVMLLPIPLTHILSKFTIKKLNFCNLRPNCLMTGTLPQKNGQFLIQTFSWLLGRQCSVPLFHSLLYLYIGLNQLLNTGEWFLTGGKKWSWWAASILGN